MTWRIRPKKSIARFWRQQPGRSTGSKGDNCLDNSQQRGLLYVLWSIERVWRTGGCRDKHQRPDLFRYLLTSACKRFHLLAVFGHRRELGHCTPLALCHHHTRLARPSSLSVLWDSRSRFTFRLSRAISCYGKPVERTNEIASRPISLVRSTGFPVATDRISRLNQKLDRGLLNLARASLPTYWAQSKPTN